MSAESLNILGNKMAYEINKDPKSSCGMLRLAAKEVYPDKAFEVLTYNEIKTVLEKSLYGRLNAIRVQNSEDVVKKMLKFLVENQIEIRGF